MAEPSHFEWLTKKSVRSSRGFELSFAGNFAFEYREPDRVMRLEGGFMHADLDGHPWGFSFDDGWPTDVSDADRMRIRSNVIEAIEFMDGRVKFR